ncbi:hypothetical protein [Leyella stercorea]
MSSTEWIKKIRSTIVAEDATEFCTSTIGFRTPPDQIPYATQSDSVRHPIGFRSPPDQIPFATR